MCILQGEIMKNAKSIGLVLRKMQRVSEVNCEIDKKCYFYCVLV